MDQASTGSAEQPGRAGARTLVHPPTPTAHLVNPLACGAPSVRCRRAALPITARVLDPAGRRLPRPGPSMTMNSVLLPPTTNGCRSTAGADGCYRPALLPPFVAPSLRRGACPLPEGSRVASSLRRFVASWLRRFLPSSLRRFVASSLPPFVASSLRPSVASSLPPSVATSLRRFVASSLLNLCHLVTRQRKSTFPNEAICKPHLNPWPAPTAPAPVTLRRHANGPWAREMPPTSRVGPLVARLAVPAGYGGDRDASARHASPQERRPSRNRASQVRVRAERALSVPTGATRSGNLQATWEHFA